ncbi:MAG TPA: zf-TFIIB domain-containing protein [Chloroflexia bacterium]|nr:zf-TFIIB domain-containing protein [Chloroflexia bacterium]
MKCPECEVELLLAERQGVEIDYCPRCRGIWLSRGKLDKLLEHSVSYQAAYPPQPQSYYPPQPQRPYRDDDHDDNDADYEHGGNRDPRNGGKKRQRGGFLGDLLDFG